ncbi:hypothetical protein STANM309S_06277 [Streptomyces tanashiensis]
MSWYSEAAFRASSNWPRRRRVCSSPEGQPVEAIRPSDHWEMVSLSIRGHFWSQPSAYASEESLKRLWSPVEFAAQIVLWV